MTKKWSQTTPHSVSFDKLEHPMHTVAISGANRGLGLEFARQYAASGARVFAGARDPENAKELNETVRASNGKLIVLPLDVAKDASVKAFAAKIGATPVDILIANAGVFGGERQHKLENIDYGEFIETLNINTAGVLRLGGALANNLKAAHGKFIAITSGMGSIAEASGGYLGYRASKAALNMVMRVLANDLKRDGVVCIPLSPGWAKTDMGGPNAPQSADETVREMRRLIERLTLGDSGKFLNWKGEGRPW
jgi:NAD(P)-dependent dehydrogenase (short-subunit alcohol dehydrogenase family)